MKRSKDIVERLAVDGDIIEAGIEGIGVLTYTAQKEK